MSRFARHNRVFFFEEPIFEDDKYELRCSVCPSTGVRVMTPVLPAETLSGQVNNLQRALLHDMFSDNRIEDFVAWYYTPMALNFSSGINPSLTVYDCMDELSAFAGAPPSMRRNEQILFEKADLVFTGGPSLFESKQAKHPSVHLFPSSVDVGHFAKALTAQTEPADQRGIPFPRLGYIGVIDERMDLELLENLAGSRSDWQIVMVGPIAKIDPATLPRAANIHYLGMKSYGDLPAYLSGWDVALLPFAQNPSTRFVSPTKTPEYLAAGRPVVSTPIRDVLHPYGELGLVEIAEPGRAFVDATESILKRGMPPGWRSQVKVFLDALSWDRTWVEMRTLMDERLATIRALAAPALVAVPPVRRPR
jgi:UDP-galactopyranose mutase